MLTNKNELKTNTKAEQKIETALNIPPGIEETVKLQKSDQKNNTRSTRKIQYGIDCADIVHFSHWFDNLTREPGGEYIKYLVIKNVVMKTQKIKYKLPQTRYFSMEFPETQTLSAGMNWTVPITFRPVAKV